MARMNEPYDVVYNVMFYDVMFCVWCLLLMLTHHDSSARMKL